MCGYLRIILWAGSIVKATEAESEENFRRELENAVAFFEESSRETTFFNPARFCYLFYRSFYMLTFKQAAEAEVQNYLAKAKSASEGSESKEKLLEAVENLANALSEVHKVREMSLGSMKCDLNTYRRYCERAAELVEKTKEKAPGATKMLERGLPIIGKRIEELLAEIEEMYKVLYPKFLADLKEQDKSSKSKIYEHFVGYVPLYLFSWDNVPGNDSEGLLRSLMDDLDIDWVENAEIHKSDDDKSICIFKDEYSVEIRMDKKKEKAILKISDGRTHDLIVKKENGKLNIYKEIMLPKRITTFREGFCSLCGVRPNRQSFITGT